MVKVCVCQQMSHWLEAFGGYVVGNGVAVTLKKRSAINDDCLFALVAQNVAILLYWVEPP